MAQQGACGVELTVHLCKGKFGAVAEHVDESAFPPDHRTSSSLKLHDTLGPLLVQNAVAAFSAPDHIASLDGILCAAVPTYVRNPRIGWCWVRAWIHDAFWMCQILVLEQACKSCNDL